jgi:hypothetical protein
MAMCENINQVGNILNQRMDAMETTMLENKPKLHPFEASLGPAPYRFAGFFDLGRCLAALNAGNVGGYNNGLNELNSMGLKSGGGTCSHCGQAILNIYVVQNSLGEKYGVGSDCIAKLGDGGRKHSPDTIKLLRAIRDHKREASNKRAQDRIKLSDVAWNPGTDSAVDIKMQEIFKNEYSWAVFVQKNGGLSGCLKVARMVEKAQAVLKESANV